MLIVVWPAAMAASSWACVLISTAENRGRHDSQRQAKACAHQRTARQKRTARAQPRGPSACARDIAAALAQRERIHCWISE
jgi:hypothetical protein